MQAFMDMLESWFNECDTNKNGRLNAEEHLAMDVKREAYYMQ
jgi:hypothetical protein